MPPPPFQRLVDAHWRDVARLTHALVGPDDGDDVAQQTWLRAYAAYPSVTSVGNLRGWLFTIAYRTATDEHRGRRRRPLPTLDLDAGPASAGPANGTVSPPSHWDESGVWAAAAALPPRQREAIVLRYVADLDHAGIAEVMGITPTMSRRLVSDALAVLRKALS